MQDLRGKVLCFSTMYADVDSGADIKHSAELKKGKQKGIYSKAPFMLVKNVHWVVNTL